jgi:hypothetical protein
MRYSLIIMAVLLLSSCAAAYNSISPERLSYSSTNLDDAILFSYKYDVLFESGNKKYAKHEEKERIKLVSVKITNNTGKKININNDVTFYAGNRPIVPMSTSGLAELLEQNTPIYLLYLLLTPLQLTKTESNGYETRTEPIFPIGIILGPGITAGNMLVSSKANKDFKHELYNYDINREIDNGQTNYYLVGFRDIGYEPLTLKLINK